MRPPTCLEDLVSDGETCSVRLVVGNELDEELVSRGDDRRGSDLPAVLPHELTALVHAVSHLHVVIPGHGTEGKDSTRSDITRAFDGVNHIVTVRCEPLISVF